MKNWINSLLRKSISKLPIRITKLLANPSVKSWMLMVQDFKRILYPLSGSITVNRVRLIKDFHVKLHLLYKAQGPKGLVIFLKVLTVLLQQVPSGYIIPDITALGCRISRTKSGLPRVIPSLQRKLIRQGDASTIRFYLSLSNYYRLIHYPGILKLSSITNPSSALPNLPEVSSLIPYFKDLFFRGISSLPSGQMTIFQTSGPQSYGDGNSSHGSLTRSASLLNKNEALDSSLRFLMSFSNQSRLESVYQDSIQQGVYQDLNLYHSFLGKLAIKEEAAGKRRVFAMVDPFTQWALQPLHACLFSVLRKFSHIDGTFDQLGPLKRVPFNQGKPIYSFDLSSATDRLPISLQVDILASVFGDEFASSWKTLLVSRPYKLPSEVKTPESVMYAVGQPMGALSSWDMLAITHHYIIQYSAWTSGVTPLGSLYSDYAVLGDDMVIWNATVAKRYLSVLKIVGVECGLHKSIISLSGSGLEFAKRTMINGLDVSPITIDEVEASHRTIGEFVAFARKYKMSLISQIRYLGFGYHILPNSKNRSVQLLKLYNSIPNTGSHALDLLKFFDRPYMSLIDAFLPRDDARRALFFLVFNELKIVKKETMLLMDSILHKSVGYAVSASGPDRSLYASIALEIMVPDMNRHVQRLYHYKDTLNFYISSLEELNRFYSTFEWEIPGHACPLSNSMNFKAATQLLFEIRDYIDLIQQNHFDLEHHPESRKPLYFKESNSRVKMMMKWFEVMKKFQP